MGRKRSNKSPSAKSESGAIKVGTKKPIKTSVPTGKDEFPLETWALDVMSSFMRSNEDIIAVAYRIPTGQLGREDIINKYKSRIMTALQQAGRNKGLVLPVEHIEFKCLPLGDETLLKGTCLRRNAIGQRDGKPIAVKRNEDPFAWSV